MVASLQCRRMRWALIGGAIVVAAALVTPGILGSYGPWADGSSSEGRPPFAAISTGDPSQTAKTIVALEKRAKGSDDPSIYVSLANAYLQRVRETADPALYASAESALDRSAELAPDDPEVAFARGNLALARHDFEAALAFGQTALAADPERARYYGLVADAQVELGLYDEAVASLQQMVDRRPDFAAFSRIAYIRELHGDVEGAIDAMEQAIEAGAPYPENLAWAHVQNGNLHFALGDLPGAEREYAASLQRLDGYAGALAGQGRLAAARGDLGRASDLYQQAFDRQPLAEYAIALGDIALGRGDHAAAEHADALVRAIDRLAAAAGVDTDLEFALFLADRGDTDAALERARAAYQKRPGIHSADALGWAYYRAGEPDQAYRYSQAALRLGSRDHLKLFHAALIARATGHELEAREYLELVLNLNPNFSVLHEEEASRVLRELTASAARP